MPGNGARSLSGGPCDSVSDEIQNTVSDVAAVAEALRASSNRGC